MHSGLAVDLALLGAIALVHYRKRCLVPVAALVAVLIKLGAWLDRKVSNA
jgi:hypothetical protein